MRLARILFILSCLPAYAAQVEGRATVIDGNTISVAGTAPRIRLDVIDAPEISQPCLDNTGARYLCGSRAAGSLADITGRYGRVSLQPNLKKSSCSYRARTWWPRLMATDSESFAAAVTRRLLLTSAIIGHQSLYRWPPRNHAVLISTQAKDILR